MFLVEYADSSDNKSLQLFDTPENAIAAAKQFFGRRETPNELSPEWGAKWCDGCVWHHHDEKKGSVDILELPTTGNSTALSILDCVEDGVHHYKLSTTDEDIVRKTATDFIVANLKPTQDQYIRVEGPPQFGNFSWAGGTHCCWFLEGFLCQKAVFRTETIEQEDGIMSAFAGVADAKVYVYMAVVNGIVVGK